MQANLPLSREQKNEIPLKIKKKIIFLNKKNIGSKN